MQVQKYILQLTKQKHVHFSLLDPDKQSPQDAGQVAQEVTAAGSSAIMIGGSTLLSQKQVDETVKAVKQQSTLPTILFPSAARFLSPYADAVFFMSLLNSRNIDFLIREHVKAAPIVKKAGIEPIPMGYVVVEPGMTVGRVGEADLLSQDDGDTAIGYALAAEYLGMNLFYLEAGSGASVPVSDTLISSVTKEVSIPVMVGGGIRDAETAQKKAKAGADIIVTGTALEQEKQLGKTVSAIVAALEEVS